MHKIVGRRALKAAFSASSFAPQMKPPGTFQVIYLPTGQPAIDGVACRASIVHTKGSGIGAVSRHMVGVGWRNN